MGALPAAKDIGGFIPLATRSFALPRPVPPAFRFALVGLSGLVVNQLAFALLTSAPFNINILVAAVVATQFSSTWNFVGVEHWAFGGRTARRGAVSRFVSFLGLNNATLLLRVPMLWLLASVIGFNPLMANLFTLVALFMVRYVVADGWIWAVVADKPLGDLGVVGADAPKRHLSAVGPSSAFEFVYDVAGVIRLDSDVELPELRYFRTETSGKADIQIRVARVGAFPSMHTRFEQKDTKLSYFEHLGMAGANFRITMGDPIKVDVTPLLAQSRHVLYTNVIEALLRFLLVSRDHVLLHSASLVVDGKAVLLSAQTDTGKTSTVIKLVRDHAYHFLSDDMTIITPDGRAVCYPKPMTLSYHTMASIKGGELPRRQRAALAIQSRLHSKSGRSVGRFMGNLNLPIMSVNSVVQILVPPPKYHINTLLDCQIGTEAPIGHVVIMERGESLRERITRDDAVPQLIDNTDDAYGFPPFSTFAPHIRIGESDYPALREKEEKLLRQALGNASMWRIRVPGHEWAEVLPLVFADGYVTPENAPHLAEVIAIPISPDAAVETVEEGSIRTAG
ncbi:MAG: hypothetical protein DLM71_07425 [Chloroflexi bacterium]|nr:MAG: hypothetical protein DLM71_07425 [Chloroflexota bacterium]